MASKMITSLTNSNIKQVVKLRDSQPRKEAGLSIIDGIREMECALKKGVVFKELYLTKDADKQESIANIVETLTDKPVSIFETVDKVFSKISYGNRQEGILAVVEPIERNFEDVTLSDQPIVVVAENIEKPGNIGAILRTCDAAGVDCLILANCKTDLYNPNVIRTSLGTVFSVPVVVSTNEEAIDFLEQNNIKTCATLPDADVLYSQAELHEPLAVVIGSEQDGLTEFWKERSDVTMRIPMKGLADSLNVSATAAVVIYEALRQRNK